MAIFVIDLAGATTQQRLAMGLLRQRVDARLGYPRAPKNPDRTPYINVADPNFGVTQQSAQVQQHPTDLTRWGLFVSAEMAVHVTFVINACQALVTAGTATALETVIASLPVPVAIDISWSG